MTGSERDVQVEERANRILGDERAATAHAAFAEAQLRHREMRARSLASLCKLGRMLARVAVRLLSAGTVFVLSPPCSNDFSPPL